MIYSVAKKFFLTQHYNQQEHGTYRYKSSIVSKKFSSFEEVAADEDFQAWYAGAGNQQAATWQQWLAQNPQSILLVDEAIVVLNALRMADQEVPVTQTEAAHKQLMKKMPAGLAPVVKIAGGRKTWWLSAAAIIILLVGSALFWKMSGNEQLKLNTVYGQVEKYKLPDGSEVMLNANSKLSMQKWKEGADREVWIEGEAFFHVKKTTTKARFVVHTRDLDIIVTGTQFNVVNREGEANVLLKEGSVTLRTGDGRLIKMLPGDYVKINNSLPKKSIAPPEKVLAWTQAKLIFENTSMLEAQKIINRHYGVKVILDKEVEEKTISGILPNDNLEVLLKALEATMDFKIVQKDNEIIISGPHSY
jgi:ferric-dicitrate binding protein FerR (iron transport regulator)